MRTAEVSRETIAPRVEAVGTIAFNERDQAVVQARATGFVEKLHVRATLDRVRGQPLAELYVPEWVAAQEEFLSVRRISGTDLAALVDAARQRMRQAGMSDEQIRASRPRRGAAAHHAHGADRRRGRRAAAREGMTVMPGATLFRINGLSTVWANAEVPESQAALLRPGAPASARPRGAGDGFVATCRRSCPKSIPRRARSRRASSSRIPAALAPGMFVNVALEPRRAKPWWCPPKR